MNTSRILRLIGGAGLAALLLAAPAAAQTPTAGTRIGNQAVATYTDGSGIQRVVVSNLVETTITQIAAVAIDAPNTLRGTVGSQVVFGHQITNNGNGNDRFDIVLTQRVTDNFNFVNLNAYADADGDGVPDDLSTPLSATPSLAPGERFSFVVAGTIPSAGPPANGDTGEVEVLARSQFNAAIDTGAVNTTVGNPGTDLDTAIVTNQGVIEITKSMSALSGPDDGTTTVTIRVDYGNTGLATATNVVIRDILPQATVGGMDYVAGSGRWSVLGATVLTDANDGTQGAGTTIDYQADTGTDTVTATINSVPPSTTGFLTFQFTVRNPTSAGTLINTAEVQYNDGSGTTIPSAGNFTPSNPVPYVIRPRPGVTVTPDPNTVASAPQGGTVTWTNVVTNTGNKTDTIDITLTTAGLTGGFNVFPAGTIFTLYKADGNSLLLDTNNTGVPDTGPLAAGATYNVILKAQLPSGATGTNFEIRKVATTQNVDGSNNPATDNNGDQLLAITAGSVDLTNDKSTDDGTIVSGGITTGPNGDGAGVGPEALNDHVRVVTGNPGQTVTFNLVVNLQTDPADNFDLRAFSDAALTTAFPWPVVFRDRNGANLGNTGALSNGATNVANEIGGGADGTDEKLIVASVTIPAGQAPGNTEIFFRVRSPTTSVTDAIRDRITVNEVRDVRLSPNNLQGQTFPGGTRVYTHILENFGNTTEGTGDATGSDIILNITDSNAGAANPFVPTLLYYDVNNDGVLDAGDLLVASGTAIHTLAPASLADGLAPGERQRFFLFVEAKSAATAGDANTVTLTANVSDLVAVSFTAPDPTDPSVSDLTVVVFGDLELNKRQALDTGCNGPDTAYGAAVVSAAPGDCIRYRLTLTNTGAVNATSVSLSDSTPAFTTLSDGDNSTNSDNGQPVFRINAGAFSLVTDADPGPGGTGEVRQDLGTIAPSAVVELYYGVRVNP